ncbi:MAG TPA: C-terminal binding protein [Armatimonadota bacterium]|jgi:D-3-phosphoglycerate dehydrogenase
MAQLVVFATDYTLAKEYDRERELLAAVGAELIVAQCRSEQEILEQMPPCDAIISQWAPLTRRVMEAAGRLRAISRNGIGVDNIDLEAARELGVQVFNVPDYCVPEVAEHTLALILAVVRKLAPTARRMDAGGWGVDPLVPIHRMHDQTLGILGLGRIGQAVAERARPLFGRIIACDPQASAETRARLGVEAVGPEEFWGEADVITLHLPLTEETRHTINADTLNRMKPGAYLVNTCRGGVVDTAAVVAALRSGQLAGVGLDVHEEEPLPADHPLRHLDNALVTPHVAFYSEESVAIARDRTCENLVRFFRGEEPRSRVV